jgi:histidyl-tRNA synthetase
VRSAIQHGLLMTPGLKVWYQGPMFRHERPQKGRQRQFHQFGAEVFGLAEAAADAELIALVERLWMRLGLAGRTRLEINTLGDRADRERYRSRLVSYLEPHRDRLDEDSRRRLETNPLRIFDSKDPDTRAIMRDAPRLADSLGDQARAHFDSVRALLDRLGIAYSVNPGLVRGLDYYCRTVFEWVTDDLGAQGTVCAGGRYDDLVAVQGGKPTPGIGFALGVERLLALLDAAGVERSRVADVFMVSQVSAGDMLSVAERIRDALPDIDLAVALSGGSLRSQFKRADRSGARWCVILGEAEFSRGQVSIKDLRGADAAQEDVALDALPARLQALLAPDRND